MCAVAHSCKYVRLETYKKTLDANCMQIQYNDIIEPAKCKATSPTFVMKADKSPHELMCMRGTIWRRSLFIPTRLSKCTYWCQPLISM